VQTESGSNGAQEAYGVKISQVMVAYITCK